MDRLEEDTNKPMMRDRMGRFAEGNNEGRKFPKGYDGRHKGVKNRKTMRTSDCRIRIYLYDRGSPFLCVNNV